MLAIVLGHSRWPTLLRLATYAVLAAMAVADGVLLVRGKVPLDVLLLNALPLCLLIVLDLVFHRNLPERLAVLLLVIGITGFGFLFL